MNSWLAYREIVSTTQPRHSNLCMTKVDLKPKGLQEGIIESVKATDHHYLSESTIFTAKGMDRRVRKN